MQLDDMDYELLFRMCHLPAGCPPQLMCWSCFHHTRRHPLMSPFDQVHLEAARRRQSLLDQFIVLHDRLGTATRKCSVLSKVMSSCAAHSPRFYGSIQIAALVALNGALHADEYVFARRHAIYIITMCRWLPEKPSFSVLWLD